MPHSTPQKSEPMPPELDPEEDYASSEDSDFAPEDAPERESSPSDGEDVAREQRPAASARKRRAGDDEAEDAGFENSGDEAIIEKGKKRRKKTKAKPSDGDDADDAGGEGGLIKTRSMRAQQKAERKAAGPTGPVTIDADALWAQMTGAAPTPTAATERTEHDELPATDTGGKPQSGPNAQPPPTDGAGQEKESSDMIRIKRTYNFAGKVHSEEKLVARDSAEARLYLASLGENAAESAAAADGEQPAKRMPRKAFRSVFEPITDQVLQRADLNLGMSVRLRARELAKEANAKKLNTVEKSRMDWAGYVDKEGIKDELELAGKSKDSFAGRQEFLARSEAKREDDARRARLAGRV